MKYDEELIKIVKNKKFKTFWHCFDYLVIAGYPTMDAFGVSLQEFGESKVYSDVAFIRVLSRTQLLGTRNVYGRSVRQIKIGIVNSSNIHLAGLYSSYRTWIAKNDVVYSDVEETCDIIDIPELSPFLMDYLLSLSKLHYGFEAFKYTPPDNTYVVPPNDGFGYTAGIDPATGIYSLQPEINALIHGQQRLTDLQRGLNRNND